MIEKIIYIVRVDSDQIVIPIPPEFQHRRLEITIRLLDQKENKDAQPEGDAHDPN